MEVKGITYRKSAIMTLIAALVFSMFQFVAFPSAKAEAADNGYKIVGYYPSWAAYGRNYQVMDMDVSKVTHINYAFADICWNGRHGNPDPTGPNPVTWTCQNENSQTISVPNGTIVLGDPWIDTGKRMGGDPWDAPYSGNIAELNRLKAANPQLRTIISVGGWTWSNRFSDVAADPATREVFANSAVDFLRKYNFDGVDLDWEYPVSGGLAGNSVRPQDGANYVLLLQKIREKLDAAGTADGKYYELTIASGASPAYVSNNNLAGIAQAVDFINMMTYDFNGGWQTVSAHNAPLYYDPAATAGGVPNAADFNIAAAVENYLDNGVPPGKLVLGTPFYGRGWGGCANTASGQYQVCSGVTSVGTWEKGSFDYSDLENNYINKNGYTRYWNDVAKVPYLYNASNGNFISYDDTESFGHKTDYIKSKGLAGAMFWEFSSDRNKTLLNKLTTDLSGPRIPAENVPPTVPGNLRTTSVGAYSASLEWDASTDNSGVAGYIVSYGSGSVTVTATSTTVGGLTPNTPYTFTVKAVDIFGNESGASNAVAVTTEPSNDVTPPTTPANLQVGATTVDSIALSWSASADDVGVAGYTVTYGTNSVEVSGTSAVIGGLDADTAYTFSVTARDGAGNVSAPATIQASTKPVNLCAAQEWNSGTIYTGGQRVSYNGSVYEAKWWTQGERPDLSGEWGVWKLIGACGLAAAPAGGQAMSLAGSSFIIAAALAATDAPTSGDACTTLEWKNDMIYTGGQIVFHDGHQWRAKWWTTGEVPGTTGQWGVWEDLGPCDAGGNEAPTAPTNLTVTGVTSNSVSLSWGASTDDHQVASYTVYYGGGSQTVTGTSTTVSGLAAETQYTFTVKAKDNEGLESGASNSVAATTSGTTGPVNQPPTAPANVTVTGKTASSVSLSWDASTDDGQVTGYIVSYNGGSQTVGGTGATIAGLTAGTEYTFTVKAQDNEGLLSEASTSVTAITDNPPTGQNACRPAGLYDSGVANVPYCDVYDTDGREKLANDAKRRIIGYFTSWRTGKDGLPKYLASDIPWDNITHINYAFAHVDSGNRISVGSQTPTNPATGMTWPEYSDAVMNPNLPYKGHLNMLNTFKNQHPGVKTLVSVGGWAETGGYFGDNGDRVASGGFYTMTTNANGTVNQAGIDTFADSVVEFLRQYGFDGVDIDYEYPTSMKDAGNPLDWSFATPRLAGLQKSYDALLQTLRTKLDEAAAADGKYYMLTIASPSSGYLLRGMETFDQLKYLDYVNIMSYDLHGAWNEFVGPNAALFDDGKDAELLKGNIYSTSQYGGIGYLNTDWAYHYMRGMMQAGRINIGIPYYTRGWQDVTGGTNGLWGKSVGSNCAAGLTTCGKGAMGIDNLWHDKDENGNEMGAGSNPMWHAKNLENGILGSYLGSYGLANASLNGSYMRNYDSTLVAPWLWNAQTRTFLSTEDEQSAAAKADYVMNNGIGGIMIWELAGDYDWYPQRNNGQGEYYVGSTLTKLIHGKFVNATPYGNSNEGSVPTPAQKLDVTVKITGFKLGDQNYPINPTLVVTNNSNVTIAGGSVIEFDVPTSTSPQFGSWSGDQVQVVSVGHTGNNVGGLTGDFHRIAVTLPGWKSIAPGATMDFNLVYYLPISGPTNYTLTIGGQRYAINR